MEWGSKMDGRVARRCKENGYEKDKVNACPPRKEDEIRSALYTLEYECNLWINGLDRSNNNITRKLRFQGKWIIIFLLYLQRNQSSSLVEHAFNSSPPLIKMLSVIYS